MKVLVVDDDPVTQQLMRILLAQEGHHVEVASNGAEAFDAIKGQQFDVVFMDLNMPVMDGKQSSRCIREWEDGKQRTFIVALTASYLPDERQGLLDAGMDDCIAKPFEIQHVQQMLRDRMDLRPLLSPQVIPPNEGVTW